MLSIFGFKIIFVFFIRLLLGVMYVTGFISLWISNTAATSMMLPIALALAKEFGKLENDLKKKQVGIKG